ncbi:hypothetical protein A2U01_0068967, partial [Trifolium medium]|nr:hypothetical protein [Trifolium medium]
MRKGEGIIVAGIIDYWSSCVIVEENGGDGGFEGMVSGQRVVVEQQSINSSEGGVVPADTLMLKSEISKH